MYILQVKEKDHIKILSVFHILMALIFLFDFAYTDRKGEKDWVFSATYLIAAIFLMISGIFSKKIIPSISKHISLLLFNAVLLSGGSIYFWSKDLLLIAASHVILGGVVVFIWIFLKKRENGERIVVSEQSIILPQLFKDKIISWKELSNLIKRKDLLTIDFRNNKLLQTEIINSENIDENEFNLFCQEQLDASIK